MEDVLTDVHAFEGKIIKNTQNERAIFVPVYYTYPSIYLFLLLTI